MAESVAARHDKLIEEQLRGIKEGQTRLEAAVIGLTGKIDEVRTAELDKIKGQANTVEASLRAELAKQAADLQLLRYQMGRTAAVWSMITGLVVTAIGGGLMALLMRH